MRIRGKGAALLSAALLITVGLATAAAADPAANDSIAQAAALDPVEADQFVEVAPNTVDATEATLEGNEPQPSSTGCVSMTHTVWFQWSAPATGLLRVGTYADPSLDPEVAIYSGADAPLTPVGCNNDGDFGAHDDFAGDPHDALLDVSVTQGTKYWVQMGFIGSVGDVLQYQSAYSGKPANDDVAGASTAFAGDIDGDAQTQSNVTSATTEPNEPQPQGGTCGVVSRSRWWKYNPTATGVTDLVVGGDDDSQVAVYSGLTPTTEVGCLTADDGGLLRFTATVGTSYWLQVATSHPAGWNNAAFLLVAHQPPTNASPASAASIDMSHWMEEGFGIGFDTVLADGPTLQPTRCTSALQRAVWYRFTAPADASVRFVAPFIEAPEGDEGLDVVAVYAGGSSPSSLLACGTYNRDDPLGDAPEVGGTIWFGPEATATVAKGKKYWVQIGGTDTKTGFGGLVGAAKNLSPLLKQSSAKGKITLKVTVAATYSGKTVYFFQRSGITGKVQPQGTAVVNSSGVATRVLQKRVGQTLAIYAKVIGAQNIVSPYSNTVTFKTK